MKEWGGGDGGCGVIMTSVDVGPALWVVLDGGGRVRGWRMCAWGPWRMVVL